MHSPYRIVAILQITCIIVLILLTLLIAPPLQRQLGARIHDVKNDILRLSEESFGGKISFSSIHPSIFNFIEIRNLRIQDNNGQDILHADRFILFYRLGVLLRDGPLAAPRLIELRGGTTFLGNLLALDSSSDISDVSSSKSSINLGAVLTALSDDVVIRLRNYGLHMKNENIELQTRVSRGLITLGHDRLKLDIFNKSRILIPSGMSESGIIELEGDSQLSGQVFLPPQLSPSEIREKSIVQLYVSTQDIQSTFFEVDPLNMYLSYANDTLVLQNFEDDFAFEISHNVNIPLNISAEPKFAVIEPSAIPALTLKLVASEWMPTTMFRFKRNFRQFNYLLESLIDADISIEISDDLIPISSQVDFTARTAFEPLAHDTTFNLTFNYLDGMFSLDTARFMTLAGDGLQVQGQGDLRNMSFSLTGLAQNNGIAILPEFATAFDIDYQDFSGNLHLYDSSFFGVNIGEVLVSSQFYSDVIDVDLEVLLASGKGALRTNVRFSELSDGIVPGFMDVEMFFNDILLTEAVDIITSVAGVPELTLPEDLNNSSILASVNYQMNLNSALEDHRKFAIRDFRIYTPDSPTIHLEMDASFIDDVLKIPTMDIHYQDQIIRLSTIGDFGNPNRYILDSTVMINSFSYASTVSIFPRSGTILLQGSYNTRFTFRQFEEETRGRISLGHFPLTIVGADAWIGGSIVFAVDKDDLWNSEISIKGLGLNQFELFPGITDSKLVIDASGNLKTGIKIDDLLYSDVLSSFSGSGSIVLDEFRENLSSNIVLANDLETHTADFDFSFLTGRLSAVYNLENFAIRRLGISDITGLFDAQGNFTLNGVQDMQLSFVLQTDTANFQDEPLQAELSGSFRDEQLFLSNGYFKLTTVAFRDVEGVINFGDGGLSIGMSVYVADLNRRLILTQFINADMMLPSIIHFQRDNLLPIYQGASGNILTSFVDESGRVSEEWNLHLLGNGDNLLLNGGPTYAHDKVKGVFYSNGQFSLDFESPLPVVFSAEGFFSAGIVDMNLSHIRIQPDTITIANQDFMLRNGVTEGSIRIYGRIIDPNFFGTLFIEDLKADISLIPEPLLALNVVMIMEEQSIIFSPTFVETGSGGALLEGELVMDHWIPINLYLKIDSQQDSVPILYDFNSVTVDGLMSGQIALNIDLADAALNIDGDIMANATDITISSKSSSENVSQDSTPINVDMRIRTGRGVEFYWPTRNLPILRTSAVSGEEILFNYSNVLSQFSLEGDVNLKGGEIFYFDQDFYIRTGSISFNENEQKDFDPLINLVAEFRETNAGDPFHIYLEIENDILSEMQPRFTSNPSRSPEEILVLLGGKAAGIDSVVADETQTSLSSVIASGSQILGQLRPLVDLENNLRRILNLDVLSIRTGAIETLVENVITQSFTPNLVDPENTSLSEYLKNTSIIIGKYFGTDVFFEGIVQLQESSLLNRTNANGLGLEIVPEIRFDWYTPIFTITWSWEVLKTPETLSITDNKIVFLTDFSPLVKK